MHVGAQRPRLAAHDQRDLGVSLHAQETVHDLHPGALQLVRPADIGLLVEARLQFDHRGDRLAGLCRLGQLTDDRTVLAGAVQRLLDRDDRRVARRLAQELDDDVEALIRVMDDDVLLPDRRETVAAEFADALREARHIRRKNQLRPLVADDQPARVVKPQNARSREHVRRAGGEMLAEEPSQIGRHTGIDREMDDMAAPSPLQRGLEQADEVLRLLFDLDLAVAQHAEHALRNHDEAGEQPIEKQRDHLLDRQEPDAAAGQPDKAIDRGRDQDQRLQPLAVTHPVELQRQTEPAIGDKRKRVRRIERQRRQNRKQILHETLFEPGAVARFEISRFDDCDPGLGKLGAQRHPGHLLRFHQRTGTLPDRIQLLHRGQPVLAQRLDAGEALALEAGNAHHVELIEIARRDRQKAQPLQQGMAHILGLRQNALVERQPGQLAVDKARRRGRLAGAHIDDLCALAHGNPPLPSSIWRDAARLSSGRIHRC